MQSVSSRIWTRFAVSISYDDNDYTTGTSNLHMMENKEALLVGNVCLKTFVSSKDIICVIQIVCDYLR